MEQFKQLEITPIDDLKITACGEIIALPPFSNGSTFNAKLRRPSMLMLMKSGKIPNSLMSAASSLFSGGVASKVEANDGFFKDVFEVIEILAEASFMSPSWSELKEAGIELTDDQLIFLFNYTQKGVKALESFRE